jgi:phospholipid transport system transporter-binding protein
VSECARLEFEGEAIRLGGNVDFTTAAALEMEGEQWLREQAPTLCRLDLGGITHCNSAATALLLSWLRTAHSVGKTLTIENVPQALRGMMHLAGLDEFLTTS